MQDEAAATLDHIEGVIGLAGEPMHDFTGRRGARHPAQRYARNTSFPRVKPMRAAPACPAEGSGSV